MKHSFTRPWILIACCLPLVLIGSQDFAERLQQAANDPAIMAALVTEGPIHFERLADILAEENNLSTKARALVVHWIPDAFHLHGVSLPEGVPLNRMAWRQLLGLETAAPDRLGEALNRWSTALLTQALVDTGPRATSVVTTLLLQRDRNDMNRTDLLSRLRQAEWLPLAELTAALADASPKVRARAAHSLGELLHDHIGLEKQRLGYQMLHVLAPLFADPDPGVVSAAAEAYGRCLSLEGVHEFGRDSDWSKATGIPFALTSLEDRLHATSPGVYIAAVALVRRQIAALDPLQTWSSGSRGDNLLPRLQAFPPLKTTVRLLVHGAGDEPSRAVAALIGLHQVPAALSEWMLPALEKGLDHANERVRCEAMGLVRHLGPAAWPCKDRILAQIALDPSAAAHLGAMIAPDLDSLWTQENRPEILQALGELLWIMRQDRLNLRYQGTLRGIYLPEEQRSDQKAVRQELERDPLAMRIIAILRQASAGSDRSLSQLAKEYLQKLISGT